MKILFHINNIPPNYGGGYLRVFKTAARFKTYGELYKIITYTRKQDYVEEYMNVTKNDIVFCTNKIFSSFITLPCYIIKNRKEFDVFYVASVRWHTLFPSFVAKLVGKKVVHGVTLSMVDSPAAKTNNILLKPYYTIKNSQFRLANYIFVNSPLLVEECVNYGLKKERVKLINNPVDTTKFYPVSLEEKNNIRKSLNLLEEQFTILFVGSFNKRKGCDILQDVFTEVLRVIEKPITFVMCGQKGYPETETILTQLQVLFEEAGSNLVIREEVRDTSPYYQAADLFLFPTTNEGMPNVILEAMASGCMIKCNTLPGITNYVLEEKFLVHDNNLEEYVKGITDYYYHKENYEDSIKENRKLIEKEYSVEAVDYAIEATFS